MISLCVDGILYTSSSSTLLEEFKKEMMGTFSMTDLGKMSYFLGLEVRQGSSGIFISQRKYIEDLLKFMSMDHCKPVMTPMAVNETFQGGDDEEFIDPSLF